MERGKNLEEKRNEGSRGLDGAGAESGRQSKTRGLDGAGPESGRESKMRGLDGAGPESGRESKMRGLDGAGPESGWQVGSGWMKMIGGEFEKGYFRRLWDFVEGEYGDPAVRVFPPRGKIFEALRHSGPEDVKVVIIGQDPYHGEGEANGLAFSVCDGVRIPPSLRNILREVGDCMGCAVSTDGNLERWARQGVLLLNSVLTVREGEARSHAGRGWEEFTDCLIARLSEQVDHVVFILWGRDAIGKRGLIAGDRGHLVLTSAHPSPLSAYRGFFGSAPFRKANEFLEEHGKMPIVW